MVKINYPVRPGVPDGSSEKGIQLPKNTQINKAKYLLKHNSSFNKLIRNEDGQSLFEEYARQNKIEDYLLFWYAVEGFKKIFLQIQSEKIKNQQESEVIIMSKAIYNNFLKNNAKSRVYQWITVDTRKNIFEKISKKELDVNVFETAQNEFEDKIQKEIYPQFLKSSICQKFLNNLENKNLNKDCYINNFKTRSIENKNFDFNTETDLKKDELMNLYTRGKQNFFSSKLESKNFEKDVFEENNCCVSKVSPKFQLNEEKDSFKNMVKPKIFPENYQTLLSQRCNRDVFLNKTSTGIINELEDKVQEETYQHFKTQSIYLKCVNDLENKNFNKDCSINIFKSRLTENKKDELKNLVNKNKRSNLPVKPELDYEKVQVFISKLERIEKDRNEESNQRILKVLQKFQQKEETNSLKHLIKSKVFSEDSQTLLDQHCSRVFISNETSTSPNSNCNTPKKNYKLDQLDSSNSLSKVNTPNFKYLLGLNSNYCYNQTVIVYQYNDEIPYSIKINVSEITLKQFKQEIIKKSIDFKRQKFRYLFKKKDPIEKIYIMEELNNDYDYLPFCDGKISAKIVIDNL